jgi:uncharacterized protein (TIGR02145 family)
MSHLPAGYLLSGRYSIQRSLGQGGFGITYLAYDTKLEVEVCVKELFVSGNSTRGTDLGVVSQQVGDFSFGEFVERFMGEARRLARFQHGGIVRVLDVFQGNGTAYMVMEYVVGATLKGRVEEHGGGVSEAVALGWMGQLLEAVAVVHASGLLHRDIKPENILLTPEGRLVLIDFGSSRDFAEGQTTTQTAMLTPGYAPPEQYSTRARRGPFTDVYALGATLYFLLTGEKPLAATDRTMEELLAPRSLNGEVSEGVSEAVMRALALRPEDRYATVEALLAALTAPRQVLVEEPRVDPEPEAAPPVEPELTEPIAPPTRPGRRLGVPPVLQVILLLLFGWGLIYLLKPKDEPTTVFEKTTSEDTLSRVGEEEAPPADAPVQGKPVHTPDAASAKATKGKQPVVIDNPVKGQKQLKNTTGTVRDVDGNTYTTVRIGGRLWMVENLRTTKYRNGRPIQQLKEDSQWVNTNAGAQVVYGHSSRNADQFGRLYNWHAVKDANGLCPNGWHVPDVDDWLRLANAISSEEESAVMEATDFFADLGGYRIHNTGLFGGLKEHGNWWSSTGGPGQKAYSFSKAKSGNRLKQSPSNSQNGHSVRCVSDEN